MTFPEAIRFGISEIVRFVSPTELAFEWFLVGICVLGIATLPRITSERLRMFKLAIGPITASPRSALLVCAILPVVIRLALLPIHPVPQPSIHDEFSQLLLGDTLAHGRLTNPTPVMWEHFESIHIIQKPTYNSMYPPAQGVFLALGQSLFHEPWVGVELAIALMCAAMYWMFSGWLSRPWAVFGTVLAVLKLAVTGFWVDSYISAAVPTIGGALIVGTVPRLRSGAARSLDSVLFGLGAVILMNSRPFEGAILAAAALAISAPAFYRRTVEQGWRSLPRLVLPALVVLIIGTGWLGFYCYRVTGRATLMPYQVNRATYGWPENLAFLSPEKLTIRDPILKRMYALEVSHHDIYNSTQAIIDNLITRFFDNWTYLVGPVLTLPLFFGLIYGGKRARDLLLLLAIAFIANLSQLLLYPYHLAPVVPVMFCLIALGTQEAYEFLGRISPGRNYYLATLLPIALVLSTSLKLFGDALGVPPSSYWERGYEWQRDARADIVQWLNQRPGKHLVVVHYGQDHPVNQEWVYNAADLDQSKIIWAREVSDDSDKKLLKYYSDRQHWLVQADVYPQQVIPYPTTQLAGGAVTCSPCVPGKVSQIDAKR